MISGQENDFLVTLHCCMLINPWL